MQLLDFIRSFIADPAASDANKEAYTLVINTLRQFLGNDGDIDILSVAVGGWTDRYYDFLLNQCRSRNGRLTQAAARQRWTQLRGIVRRAVKLNIFPDIEIEPERLFDPTRKARRPARQSILPQLERLHEILSSRRASQPVWALRYRACMMLGGIDIDQYMQLPVTDVPSEGTAMVHLPHFGIDVEVQAESLMPLRLVSKQPTRKSPAATGLSTRAEAMRSSLRTLGCDLMTGGDVFTDWICAVKDLGASDEAVRDIIALRYAHEKHPSPLLADTIRSIMAGNRPKADTDLNWYAVTTFGRTPRQVMDHFDSLCERMRRLRDGHLQPAGPADEQLLAVDPMFHAPERLIPYDREASAAHPGVADATKVLRSIMFVRTRSSDIPVFAHLVRNAWVYSVVEGSRRRYCVIPPDQIYRMRRVLNYLVGYTDGLAETGSDGPVFNPGDKVRISLPGYEQYEVEVEAEQTQRERRRAGAGEAEGRVYYLVFKGEGDLRLRLPFPAELLTRLPNNE